MATKFDVLILGGGVVSHYAQFHFARGFDLSASSLCHLLVFAEESLMDALNASATTLTTAHKIPDGNPS